MIYFLLASGLTLIFGVLGVINFAHGSFYMLGVFLSYLIIRYCDFGFLYLFIPLILASLGAVSEFLLFRRIYKAEHAMQLLLSLGIIHIISDTVRLIWGATPISVPMPQIFHGFFTVKGVLITKYDLFIIAVTMFLCILMYVVLFKTKIGSIIRACAVNPEMTSCVGINVSRVFLFVFMAGIALAGIASVTAAPIVSGILGMDMQMIMIAFCVVIVGGIGSISGAFIASIIIGILESFGIILLPDFSEGFIYMIAIIILFFRPRGLFGKFVG